MWITQLKADPIVKQLDLKTVTWIVIGVVIYTGITMLVSAFKKKTVTGIGV